MLEQARAYLQDLDMLAGVKRLVVAVSGGADSMALLHMLQGGVSSGDLDCTLLCAHFDHGLRGAAGITESAHVRAYAERLGVPFLTTSLDVTEHARKHRLSIETAARQLRREQRAQWARQYDCQAIATGHHMDDNAETLLFRMARGTGYRGLCGIRPVTELEPGIRFIRPLLCLRRETIRHYLEREKVAWIEDPSNRDPQFRRNHIRHRLLPYLEESCHGSLVTALAALADQADRMQTAVDKHVDDHWNQWTTPRTNGIHLKPGLFTEEPEWRQVSAVFRALSLIGCGLRDIDQTHVQRLCAMGRTGHGHHILPGAYAAEGNPTGLHLLNDEPPNEVPDFPEADTVPIPGTTLWGPLQITATFVEARPEEQQAFFRTKKEHIEWLDADTITGPLEIRKRQPEDIFLPLGASRPKKVHPFLADAKLDPEQRQRAVVVADSTRIVWVAPVRLSEEVKVTKDTRCILQLEIKNSPFFL